MASPLLRHVPRYTVSDYETWKGNWELWDGTAVAMTPSPFSQHQRIQRNLQFTIHSQLKDRCGKECEVLSDLDWRVSDDTVVRPDLVICCPPLETPYVETAPVATVEILSPATEMIDRVAKRELYEVEGVKYYLIVDPQQPLLAGWKLVNGEAYVSLPTGSEQTLQLTDTCTVRLTTQDVFE